MAKTARAPSQPASERWRAPRNQQSLGAPASKVQGVCRTTPTTIHVGRTFIRAESISRRYFALMEPTQNICRSVSKIGNQRWILLSSATARCGSRRVSDSWSSVESEARVLRSKVTSWHRTCMRGFHPK